jgi:hypothetical protein
LVLGGIITEFLHSISILFVTLSHQIPEDALFRLIPLPPRYLLLREHLCVPGPKSMLAELEVVIWVFDAIDFKIC